MRSIPHLANAFSAAEMLVVAETVRDPGGKPPARGGPRVSEKMLGNF